MTAGRRSPARRALGRNSWPWVGVPSAAGNTTCCGASRAASGKGAARACRGGARAGVVLPVPRPGPGRGLVDADRPGLRLSPRGERDAARLGRCPRERDARAVRGPDRVVVAVKGGIEEAQRLGDDVVDGDEGVIAAVADEGELAAVR